MSNHIAEITKHPLTHDELYELVHEAEQIVKDREHDSFVRLEAMKVIYRVEENELEVGSLPDDESLELMNFLGWFAQD